MNDSSIPNSDEELERELGRELAGQLRSIRGQARLTQEEMAERCRCSRNTIVAIERNAHNAKARYLFQYKKLAIELSKDAVIQDSKDTLYQQYLGSFAARVKAFFRD